MSVNVGIARFMMNLMPAKPIYNPNYFRQEYFRHPNLKLLNEEEKMQKMIEFVENDCLQETQPLFEQYYPDFPFNEYFRNKTCLDIGCNIGGLAIYFAEKWQLKAMYGIDVNKESINAAKIFIQQKSDLNTHYDFRSAYAEKLPFKDDTFDAIISRDTIEHVRDVKETLEECKRVTKKGGFVFLVFPSYYYPFGGAHLDAVTKTLFLEWFFSAHTLNRAYQEIVSNWGNEYAWYKHESDSKYGEWEEIKAGIGINGITDKKFNAIVNKVGFSKVEFIPTPLLSVSNTGNRYPIIKHLSKMLKPLLKIEFFIEYLSHRLVYILTV